METIIVDENNIPLKQGRILKTVDVECVRCGATFEKSIKSKIDKCYRCRMDIHCERNIERNKRKKNKRAINR